MGLLPTWQAPLVSRFMEDERVEIQWNTVNGGVPSPVLGLRMGLWVDAPAVTLRALRDLFTPAYLFSSRKL